ncbi:hypothetical protein DFO46_4609 [Rhizobium sp. AG855]|nr:hypothetical protein DFO46_4609 [Rhizobium sp. AG855]
MSDRCSLILSVLILISAMTFVRSIVELPTNSRLAISVQAWSGN